MAKARLLLVLVLLSAVTLAAPIEFRECPYCHGVFTVTVDKFGHYIFSDHDYVKISMGPDSYYETCAVTYFRHIGEAILALRRVSSGRIVEAPKPAVLAGKAEEHRTEKPPASLDALTVRGPEMAQVSASRRD